MKLGFLKPRDSNRILLFLCVFTVSALIPSLGFSQAVSELKVFSENFISPTYTSTKETSFQFIGGRFQQMDASPLGMKYDLAGAYSFEQPLLSYFNISEAYHLTTYGSSEASSKVKVGRFKKTWSELDDHWNFGLIQPVFQWNPLNPEQQGLTGFNWEKNTEYGSIDLFGSFLFLPNQGPSFEVSSDGRFVKGNPWFHSPPENARISSQLYANEYQIKRPSDSEIILQKLFGAKIESSSEYSFRSRLSHFYKPSNQLALAYKGSISTSGRNIIELTPAVYYHQISALDFWYETKQIKTGIGLAYDRPDKKINFPDSEGKTVPVFEDAFLSSPFFEITLGQGWSSTLQYIIVSGGRVSEVGEDSAKNRAPMNIRYPYEEAASVSVQYYHRLRRGEGLLGKASSLQSTKNDFQIVSLEGEWRFSNLWRLNAEAQLVKAAESSYQNRNSVAAFDNNDRVQFGVSYAF